MNDKQKKAKEALQNELKERDITEPLPDKGQSKEGYSFTEVERVTVCFGPDGGLILPSVRSWHGEDALRAAVFADDEFKKNRAGSHQSGHDGGIVDIEWRCNSPRCDCQNEPYEQRFKRSVFIGRRS